MSKANRPSFIVSTADVEETSFSYPGSTEVHGASRAIGKHAGMKHIGLHVHRLPPGQRTSYPHCEEGEEEFVFVLEGEVDAWVDGHLHHMHKGDLAAFPAGTGINHTFINDGDAECVLLVGGDAAIPGSKIFYPLNPERRPDREKRGDWWPDAPQADLGPHDGRPKRR
jgi:uncharacterized cupin superfamily protein